MPVSLNTPPGGLPGGTASPQTSAMATRCRSEILRENGALVLTRSGGRLKSPVFEGRVETWSA